MDITFEHIALSSTPLIAETCKPLKNFLGISLFKYVRTYKCGKYVYLSNQADWTKEYIQNNLFLKGSFEQPTTLQYAPAYFIWSDFADDILQRSSESIGASLGITLCYPNEHWCDFYHFGTTCQKPIINYYLRKNIHQLKEFIFFFKENNHDIIQQSYSQPFYIENLSLANPVDTEKTDTLSLPKIKKYYLEAEKHSAYLTSREFNCAKLFHLGHDSKYIANHLNISQRTVEFHFNNIREKLHLANIRELSQQYGEYFY